MDQPGGEDTPTTPPSCAFGMHITNQMSHDHWKPANNPTKPHGFHMAKMHITPSRPFCHTAHARAHLISCVCGATTPTCNNTPSLPFLRPCSAQNHTAVVCLINRHGHTFYLLPCPKKRITGVKGHTRSGTQPQRCQLSRIRRETHAFGSHLTLSRLTFLFSRISMACHSV